MPRDNATTDTPTVEILRSKQLAAILTPLIMDMTREAATRYEAAGLGRVMAAPLSAIHATVNEIRKVHGLSWIDPRTGEPMISDNGQAPAEPEPAEAKS
jgi:hypothetical protein